MRLRTTESRSSRTYSMAVGFCGLTYVVIYTYFAGLCRGLVGYIGYVRLAHSVGRCEVIAFLHALLDLLVWRRLETRVLGNCPTFFFLGEISHWDTVSSQISRGRYMTLRKISTSQSSSGGWWNQNSFVGTGHGVPVLDAGPGVLPHTASFT